MRYVVLDSNVYNPSYPYFKEELTFHGHSQMGFGTSEQFTASHLEKKNKINTQPDEVWEEVPPYNQDEGVVSYLVL